MQSAERLLLEVASAKRTVGTPCPPSPSTILQCLQPDAISFNTIMLAWSSFSPKQGRRGRGASQGVGQASEDSASGHATATAKRTESILEMMQDLWDEERSNRTTSQSMQAAWDEHGGNETREEEHAPPPSGTIAPNISSYNTVLKAWSRSSDPEAALQALKVYQTVMEHSNVACLARESLVRGNSEPAGRKSHRVGDAFPDSRTLVILLQSLQHLSLSIGFQDALDTVESVFESMEKCDQQMQWSIENGIISSMARLNGGGKLKPILNVYSYNTLIKALSNLPTNWEERHHCCVRIDARIEEMKSPSSPFRREDVVQCLPNVITAWTKCAELAGKDEERVKLCAERAGAHIDELLTDSVQSNVGNDNFVGSYLIQAINETIALYGKAGMPSRADDLFLRSKECKTRNLATLSTIITVLCENNSGDIAFVEKSRGYLFDFEQEKMKISRSFIVPDMKFTSMYNEVISGNFPTLVLSS